MGLPYLCGQVGTPRCYLGTGFILCTVAQRRYGLVCLWGWFYQTLDAMNAELYVCSIL